MPRPIGTTNVPPGIWEDNHDPVAVALGALMASVRVEAKVNQREVADALDTVQSHVSEIETGTSPPNATTVIRYLVAIGVAKERKARKASNPNQ